MGLLFALLLALPGLPQNVVEVPVVVVTEDGGIVTGLQKENFRIEEEDIPQEVLGVRQVEGPFNIVLLVEYSEVTNYFHDDIVAAARAVVEAAQPEDYIAVVGYGSTPVVMQDFTRNRADVHAALARVSSIGNFGDSNLFDGVRFTLVGGESDDQTYYGLAAVDGPSVVVVVGTGVDHFSHTGFDDVRDAIAYTGIPIYTIGIGELEYIRAEPYLSSLARMDFLQAQNNLRTFAEESGGSFFSVRFRGELDDVSGAIGAMIRSQYVLTYTPQGPRKDPGDRQEIDVYVDMDGDGQEDNDDLDLQFREYRLEFIS